MKNTPSPTPGKSDRGELLDPRALDALKNHQRQLDEDGVEVGVSRQAVDEAVAYIERLRASPAESCAESAGELADMEARKNAAYLERNQVVAALASAFPSGIARTAIEGWSDDWHGCVYIDLPTGQASWHYHDSHAHLFAHLPAYAGKWDGHSTEEKYQRLAALAHPQTQPSAAGDAGESESAECPTCGAPCIAAIGNEENGPVFIYAHALEDMCAGIVDGMWGELTASTPPASASMSAGVTDAMDFDRLLAIVEAAAPDPWTVRNDNEGEDPPRPLWVVENADMETPDDADTSPVPFQVAVNYGARADAEFIATFSPSMVRGLIERARANTRAGADAI